MKILPASPIKNSLKVGTDGICAPPWLTKNRHKINTMMCFIIPSYLDSS